MFTASKNNHSLLGKVKEVTAILNMCNGDFKAKCYRDRWYWGPLF